MIYTLIGANGGGEGKTSFLKNLSVSDSEGNTLTSSFTKEKEEVKVSYRIFGGRKTFSILEISESIEKSSDFSNGFIIFVDARRVNESNLTHILEGISSEEGEENNPPQILIILSHYDEKRESFPLDNFKRESRNYPLLAFNCTKRINFELILSHLHMSLTIPFVISK